MSATDDLDVLAERLKKDDALGRSPAINAIFDFLLERSRSGPAPKETEVAAAVFHRSPSADFSQDSIVRVNVHRLRRKLDDFYAGPGKADPFRLALPKGEYRLMAVASETPTAPSPSPARARHWIAFSVAAAMLVASLAIGATVWQQASTGFGYARRSPVWSGLIADDRPITVVLGDYYIFGETDEHGEVTRLVREYDVNSAEELSRKLLQRPELLGRQVNLDLNYVPVSTGPALRSIMPILAPTPRQQARVRVIKASEMTPDLLKDSDIVYVGYFSGLGLLRDSVFSGSRFEIGETYDELIDRKAGRAYLSQEGGALVPAEMRLDYGYVSAFTSVNGARIVIIAGTRDVAVMQAAETASSRQGLAEIGRQIRARQPFEALYEVQGVHRVNLTGRLLTLSPRAAAPPLAASRAPKTGTPTPAL